MNLKLIIKGFIVGIGKVIPGVSGAMLAVMMGIYEKLIGAITNFFDNIKENSKLLGNFCLGLFIAIVLFSKIILFFLTNYYKQTIFLFLGLIMGTLRPFVKKIKFNLKNITIFSLSLILLLALSFNSGSNTFIFKGSLIHYLYTILLGFIDALSSIVPGISGTAIYMLLGSYEYVLTILSNPNSLIFLLYILGIIIGVIIVSMIMHYLLEKQKEIMDAVILGFMIGSLILLFLNVRPSFRASYLIYMVIGLFLGAIFPN